MSIRKRQREVTDIVMVVEVMAMLMETRDMGRVMEAEDTDTARNKLRSIAMATIMEINNQRNTDMDIATITASQKYLI